MLQIKEFLGKKHREMLEEAIGWIKRILDVVLRIKKGPEV